MTLSGPISNALDQLSGNLIDGNAGYSSFLDPIQGLIGPCYFAVSLLEPHTVLRRIFSNQEDQYPVGVVKSMAGTGWETAIVFEKRHLFSPDPAALHRAFPDADAIIDHGFGCAINLRMEFKGVLLGTVNLLAKLNAFNTVSFNHAKAFVAPLTLLTAIEAQNYDGTP
ncbi:hypothetical protein [Shimia sp.]|uniref:hypothetical protein n=1 Tax=Shimia sp. TaxID=1954381 RepID=UPI00329A3A4C